MIDDRNLLMNLMSSTLLTYLIQRERETVNRFRPSSLYFQGQTFQIDQDLDSQSVPSQKESPLCKKAQDNKKKENADEEKKQKRNNEYLDGSAMSNINIFFLYFFLHAQMFDAVKCFSFTVLVIISIENF